MAVEYNGGYDVVNNDINGYLNILAAFTFCYNIKVDGTSDATLRGAVSWNGTTMHQSGYNIYAINGKLDYYLRDSSGRTTTWRIISALSNYTVGQWYTCVGRFYDDGSNFQMDYWIDGVKQGNWTAVNETVTPVWQSGVKLYVGKDLLNKIFPVTISDMAIWNTNLTDDQCVQLGTFKKRGVPLQMKPDNLIGYWTMDEYNDGLDPLQEIIDGSGKFNDWNNYGTKPLSVWTVAGSSGLRLYQRPRPFP